MRLEPGMLVSGGEKVAYEVVGDGWTSARHAFYRGRKVFWNFRYPAEALDQAGRDEGLDVLLRVPLEEPSQAALAAFRFELERVLGLPDSFWFPEPLDIVDLDRGDRGAGPGAPVLVLVDPHARHLTAGPPVDPREAARRMRMLDEVCAMLEMLRRESLTVAGLDPGDFVLDGEGRWYFLGTDRVEESKSGDDPRGGLRLWARLALQAMTGSSEVEALDGLTANIHPELVARIRDVLRGTSPAGPDPRDGRRGPEPRRRGFFGLRWPGHPGD